jgi:hypothetical protein
MHRFGTHDKVFIVRQFGFVDVGTHSDERTRLWFKIAALPRQRSDSWVRIPQELINIFYSGPRMYIPPGPRWPSYTPQALSSVFVATYDSQGYERSILTRLNMGSLAFIPHLKCNSIWPLLYPRVGTIPQHSLPTYPPLVHSADDEENTLLNNVIACLPVVV